MRFLLLLICLQTGLAYATPRVVTSIAPVQEITAAIMEGVGRPELLIENEASTHHFAFRPSHIRLLQRADLVIWVSRHFEGGFQRLPEILPPHSRQLELLPLMATRASDGHIWYSPTLVTRLSREIENTLSQLDPDNRDVYRRNADTLIAEVQRWREGTRQFLQQKRPVLVTDHAFLGHFVEDMGIPEPLSIHRHHEENSGLGDLARVEASLRQAPPACLLTIEAGASGLALRLAQKYQLEIVNITAGIDTNSARAAILRRLDALAASLSNCVN